MAKSVGSTRKLTFGKRKGGKPVKSYNKHNSKSSYARNKARRR
jgi:hypothetical protein